MQADGGDIELLALDGNSAEVRLTGLCAGCPSAHMTLYLGGKFVPRFTLPIEVDAASCRPSSRTAC